MDHGEFGGLIRRKQPERKKIILPPERTPLKIKATPKAPEPPQRSPLKISVKPKKEKPQESPEVAAFKKRAEDLRQRVAARNPEMVTTTRLEPKRSQLKTKLPPNIKVTPRSYFEWVQAA